MWVAMLVIAGVGAAAYATTVSIVETTEWVDHTHEVIERLHDLRAALTEAESARRGHGLTGDETHLAGYPEAVERVRTHAATIRVMTSDNPAQQRRIDVLQPLIDRRVALLDGAIERRRSAAYGGREELEEAKVGSLTTARILAVVSEMADEERRLLLVRERSTQASVADMRLVQGVGLVASLGFLAFAFVRLRREVDLRAASEKEAREGEESLATTLRSIGDGVISTDGRGHIERMNPVAEKLTGWSLADAKGKPFLEVFRIVNELTDEPATNPVERVLREGVVVGLANHTALIAKDGSKKPIADSAAPIHDRAGRVTGTVLVFRDMTAERAAAEAAREANAFLDSIVENIPHMIFVKDAAELRFVRFNRAGEELLGTKREALLGKNDFDFFPEEQAVFFQEKDRHVLAGKDVLDIPEEPIKTPHGERWLHTKKIPMPGEGGRPGYLLGISEDISERKAMADELRRAHADLERRVEERTRQLRASEEQLRQSQKMEAVGRLAGGIAHDFNNLLSVILSYSSLLAQNLSPDDETRADLEEIRRAGERATDLTRQLLAFSRQQVLTPKIVDLNEIIVGMDRMLRRLIGEDIELRTVPAARLGKVEVDPSQMEQVIMNLVVNARDAMPSGGAITIETGNVDLDEAYAAQHSGVAPGRHVMLVVTDTGDGIDRETQERIFEPFFTTKERGKGTGLGLSTVFGIVKQSGGHIWVYSEPDKGTAFKVYLPRVDDSTPGQTRSRPQTEPPMRGFETILLVEDEDQVRVLARNILKRCGYQVIDARNAGEALLLCERFSGTIHLLATDLVMPKMSGRELAQRLAVVRPDIKVLFMSGYTDDVVVRGGALAEGVAFLQKPITPDSLTRKVREVLDAP
jgi:PAS domain S-box-containing protein